MNKQEAINKYDKEVLKLLVFSFIFFISFAFLFTKMGLTILVMGLFLMNNSINKLEKMENE